MTHKQALAATLKNMFQYRWRLVICFMGLPISICFYSKAWLFAWLFIAQLIYFIGYAFWKYKQFRKDKIPQATNKTIGGNK